MEKPDVSFGQVVMLQLGILFLNGFTRLLNSYTLSLILLGHIEVKHGIPEFLRLLRTGGIAVYTISFTLEKGAVMMEHAPFVTNKQIQVERIERRFYHVIGKDPVYCEVYCIRKL